MGRSAKILAGIVGVAAVLLVGFRVFQKPIATALIDRQLEANMARDLIGELADGLHVGLCGAAGPFPNRDRRATCVFVIAGEDLYIIDSGAGSPGTISSMGLPTGRIKAILLTHFHSDHIDGLGELMMNRWIQGNRTEPVPVYGPPGVERIVKGFNEAYALDSRYRTGHHGEALAPPSGSGGEARTIPIEHYEMAFADVPAGEGLTITAFNVDHSPISPAVGYRFDYKDRTVVITGDTAPSEHVRLKAYGADVLVHEALQPRIIGKFKAKAEEQGLAMRAKLLGDILDYHTSPEEAAKIAQKANVDYLLLYHIVPPLPSFFDRLFMGDAPKWFDGPIRIGTDGFMLSLPVGTDRIEERDLLRN